MPSTKKIPVDITLHCDIFIAIFLIFRGLKLTNSILLYFRWYYCFFQDVVVYCANKTV